MTHPGFAGAAGLLLLLTAGALAPAGAETVRAEFGGLVFTLEDSEWRVRGGFHTFTCVAADCDGEPGVHLVEQTDDRACPANAPDLVNRRRLAIEPAPETAGGVEIMAWLERTGCHWVDTPILNACVVHEGRTHLLTTALWRGGCNSIPRLPEGRFLDLLGGIGAKEPGTP